APLDGRKVCQGVKNSGFAACCAVRLRSRPEPVEGRKGSALPYTELQTKLVRLSRLSESRRFSAQRAAELQQAVAVDFFTPCAAFRQAAQPRFFHTFNGAGIIPFSAFPVLRPPD